jgi:hypothetical protein
LPAQPAWISRLPSILAALRALPRPFVDRQTLETLLGVGRRRAQEILAPCVTERVGPNGLADRGQLILHLEQLARGEEVTFEQRRRQRVAEALSTLRKERLEQPPVLVEAPPTIVHQEVQQLPKGIHLSPGQIVIDQFRTADEAKRLLLALILAIGNNPDEFETRIAVNHKPMQ